MGAKKRPFYRFVAADSRFARDGRFLETLGYYNPIERPAKVKIDEQKVFKWLKEGAQMSETVASLFRQVNLLAKWEKVKSGETGDDIELKTEIRERHKRRKKTKAAAEIKEEAKPEEKKPEEKKAEEAKPKEAKPKDTKTEETKTEETKPEETKAEETKPEEAKADNTTETETPAEQKNASDNE
jgi:small subunit ribosomal protein S16